MHNGTRTMAQTQRWNLLTQKHTVCAGGTVWSERQVSPWTSTYFGSEYSKPDSSSPWYLSFSRLVLFCVEVCVIINVSDHVRADSVTTAVRASTNNWSKEQNRETNARRCRGQKSGALLGGALGYSSGDASAVSYRAAMCAYSSCWHCLGTSKTRGDGACGTNSSNTYSRRSPEVWSARARQSA